MKLWIARDKDWELRLYTSFPYCSVGGVWRTYENGDDMSIDPNQFLTVTYENSPQEVELKLIEK